MLSQRVRLSGDALFQEINNEAVILDLASSCYFGLDGVGVRLWQLLEQSPSLQAACDRLLEEYDVSVDQLEKDVVALISAMAEAGLVHVE